MAYEFKSHRNHRGKPRFNRKQFSNRYLREMDGGSPNHLAMRRNPLGWNMNVYDSLISDGGDDLYSFIYSSIGKKAEDVFRRFDKAIRSLRPHFNKHYRMSPREMFYNILDSRWGRLYVDEDGIIRERDRNRGMRRLRELWGDENGNLIANSDELDV